MMTNIERMKQIIESEKAKIENYEKTLSHIEHVEINYDIDFYFQSEIFGRNENICLIRLDQKELFSKEDIDAIYIEAKILSLDQAFCVEPCNFFISVTTNVNEEKIIKLLKKFGYEIVKCSEFILLSKINL